jgi:hypothetical protein
MEDVRLVSVEVTLVPHEAEPATMLRAQSPRAIAHAVELADGGALAAATGELAVDALDLEGTAREEGLEELFGLELEVDGAAGGQLGRGVGLEVGAQGGGGRDEREEAAEAVEEDAGGCRRSR